MITGMGIPRAHNRMPRMVTPPAIGATVTTQSSVAVRCKTRSQLGGYRTVFWEPAVPACACGLPASGSTVVHPREDAMIPHIKFEPNASAPLDGIRVVDLSRLVA